MKKLIRQIDIFGTQVGFVVDQDQFYKTSVGAAGTIVFITIVAVLVFFSLGGILQKQNVTVSQHKSLQLRSDNIRLNNTNFMFAIKIHSQINNSIPVYAQQIVLTDVFSEQAVKIFPLIQCQNQHFQQLTFYNVSLKTELLGIADISSWYCPASDFQFLIYKDIETSLSQAILLNFFLGQIERTIINLDVLYAYQDIYEYKAQPMEGHLITFSYQINPLLDLSVSSDLQFYKWVVETDESILPIADLSDSIFYLTSPSDGTQKYLMQLENQPYQYFQLKIQASRTVITSNRQYEKIQKAISFIGGFIEVVRVLFLLIFSTYNSFDLWLKLSRQFLVMHVDENALKDEPIEQKKKFVRTKKSGNAFSFKYSSIINIDSPKVKDDVVEDKKTEDIPSLRSKKVNRKKILSLQEFQSKLSYILQSTKVMVPKFKHYILTAFCCCHSNFAKNRIIFETAVNVITQDLDIFRYIQALSDIEKLKRLLLDDEQRQLFDFKKKQDVFIKRNPQGEIIIQKGFNVQNEGKTTIKNLVEPKPMDPIHVQLGTYEEVWKILIKLRNHQEKPGTLVYKINNGLTQFLRQDVRDLFDDMLEQNDKQVSFDRLKTRQDKLDISNSLSNGRISFDQRKVSIMNLPQELDESIFINEKEYSKPLLQSEVELTNFSAIKSILLQESKQSDLRVIEQGAQIDLMQIFQDDLDLVYIKNFVRISLKSSVEWREQEDYQPFGLINCVLNLQNLSDTSFDHCSFNYEIRYLTQFQQEDIIELESINEYKQLYEQDSIKVGDSLELSQVYQIIPVEQLLYLNDQRDITKITLMDMLSLTNQHIIISFSSRAQSYKIILRLHNSIIKNWITQRPNTDVLVDEAIHFREEVYFNIGKGMRENFYNLQKIFNQEFIIDKLTLIDEIRIANIDPESDFDLEQHFEEQATLENVMFIMMLNPKLLDILASQSLKKKDQFPSLWKGLFSGISQDEQKDLLKREYQFYVEIQYNKNQSTSLFYLCTKTQSQQEKSYYLERLAVIHITQLAMASYYQQEL